MSATEFVASEQIEASDVADVERRVSQARRQTNANKAKRGDAKPVHDVDHQHDTAADTEGSVDTVERETEVIEWQDPGNLEAPPPLPGMVQRWVRASFRTGDDPGNITRALREGWRPRPVSSVPDGYTPATAQHKSLGEVIAVEGLVLCHMPIRVARQRAAFYAKLLAAQNEAIERDVHRDERPGMPITAERRSRVTHGRRPEVE